MTDHTYPEDYCSPQTFHRQYPHAHTSMNALRWELRFRHQNGLVDSGAVIERWADPKASRPTLLISPSRYFGWLRAASRGAA